MNTLVIEKQTGGYFKFTLNGDTANAITSIQNDLLAVGTQLHFKTGNGANIIKEQFIYPADVTIIASGTFTFTTVAQVWDKLIDIDYFAWLGGGGTGGVDRFDDLLDTFSYTGNAGKAVVVDGSELRLVPITLYNKRLFTELEDTPSSLVPNKMLVVNPAGTAVVLQDQPEQPEQLLNSVGYFDYNDLITQTTPLNAVANVALKLTNDTEGANTSTDQNPYGVSYVWDYTTNQFNFNELEVGDTIDVRIHVHITTTTSNQKVVLSSKLGIGSPSEFINSIYENQFKSSGLHEISVVAPFYMGSTDITDYPAELYLTTDSSATVKVDGWYVRILRKNINIITVDYTVPDATTTVKGIVRLAGDLAGTANSPTVPELANKVPTSRTVSTTSPLLGGGALSSNLTLSIQQANSVDSGYLSNVDWSTFNGKANDNAVVKLTGDQSITGSKSFTTNTAAPAMVVTNNSTDNGILLQNTSTGRGVTSNNVSTGIGFYFSNASTGTSIYSVNSSTGKGIHSINSSTGQGIYSENSLGGWGIFSNNASTGRGINSVNSSTGTGFYSTNSSGGTGIESYNSSSGTGFYSNNSSTGNGIQSINSSSGYGISSSNTGSGRGIYSSNNSTGDAINIANSGSGRGIYLTNASSGKSLILNNDTAATGMPFTVSKNGTDKFTINDAGETTGVKFIKSGGTSSQFLKADGSVDSSTYALTSQLHDAVTLGTTGVLNGLSLSGQVLSLATASSTTRGALTAEDYSYFFGKQNALTNPVTGTGTTNYIPKFIGASAIGNSLIYDDGTNVGIGTTSPAQKLDVNGFIKADSGFKVGNNGQIVPNGYWGNLTYAGSGAGFDYGLVTSAGAGIAGVPTGTDTFYIANKLGIGTTSPAVKFHSYGGALSVGDESSYSARFSNNSNKGVVIGYDSTNNKGHIGSINPAVAWTDLILNANGGNVGIGTTSPGGKLHVVGKGIFDIGSSSGDVLVVDKLSGGNIAFNINGVYSGQIGAVGSGDLYIASKSTYPAIVVKDGGNVGIGTTSPSGLWSGTNKTLQITGGSGVASELVQSRPSATITRFLSGTADTFGVYTADALNYEVYTSNVARLRITSGGNVGIGTTSPTMALQINKDYDQLKLSTSGSSNYMALRSGTSYCSLSYGASGAEALTILHSNGNVGIGTTSPNQLLSISSSAVGGSTFGLYNTASNTDNRNWALKLNANNYGDLGFFVSSSNGGNPESGSIPMLINKSGNVGIGTTSPDNGKLTILKNTSNATESSYGIAIQSNASNAYTELLLGADDTVDCGVIQTAGKNTSFTSKKLALQPNGGNVGIGTTSPSYTLHVNGSVAGTSAYVNLSDKRHKKDILPIENALDKILALNGVTFNWDKESTDMNLDDNNHIGLLAQDVEQVIPQAVVTAQDENETKSVAYTDLVPVLIEAIKELTNRINILENK